MIAFGPEVFFALIQQYNELIWPVQAAAWALGALVVALVFGGTQASTRVIGAVLALFWLWTGLVWHWVTFAPIDFAAPVYAGAFVLQALLLLLLFTFGSKSTFRFQQDAPGWGGLALMAFALGVYPLLGPLMGRPWAQGAMFGVSPGSVAIFTLGVLLLARPRVSWTALVIPLLWCAMGGVGAWLLGVSEDAALPVAGVAALVLAVAKNRRVT